MASSAELIRKRSEYYVFLEQINSVASDMIAAIDNLNSPVKKMRENYTINSENGDKGKLSGLQQSLQNNYGKLTNSVIPSINSEINSLSRDIEYALAEEERERQERERQEREKQELERKKLEELNKKQQTLE